MQASSDASAKPDASTQGADAGKTPTSDSSDPQTDSIRDAEAAAAWLASMMQTIDSAATVPADAAAQAVETAQGGSAGSASAPSAGVSAVPAAVDPSILSTKDAMDTSGVVVPQVSEQGSAKVVSSTSTPIAAVTSETMTPQALSNGAEAPTQKESSTLEIAAAGASAREEESPSGSLRAIMGDTTAALRNAATTVDGGAASDAEVESSARIAGATSDIPNGAQEQGPRASNDSSFQSAHSQQEFQSGREGQTSSTFSHQMESSSMVPSSNGASSSLTAPTARLAPVAATAPVPPAPWEVGTPSVRMDVTTPDGNPVQVHVSLVHQTVYARVVTGQSDVQDFLTRNQTRLENQLQQQGLEMGSFVVDSGQQQGQGRQQWEASTAAHDDMPRPERRQDGAVEQAPTTAVAARSSRSRLHIVA
ncbi:MAG: flagellar hook-length control protein FliK [Nitrospiraceae bacterium]